MLQIMRCVSRLKLFALLLLGLKLQFLHYCFELSSQLLLFAQFLADLFDLPIQIVNFSQLGFQLFAALSLPFEMLQFVLLLIAQQDFQLFDVISISIYNVL